MKFEKLKEIIAKDISEIPKEYSLFYDRNILHNGEVPSFYAYILDLAWNAFIHHGNNVYKEIKAEAQGIFIGQYYKDEFGEFILVSKYEEGDGIEHSGYVEMSDECLANISIRCQQNDTLMVVWVHTHPGFNAWYSKTDCNNLLTNFYKPYQMGIVVDILNKNYKGFKVRNTNVDVFENFSLFNINNTLFSPYTIPLVKENNAIITKLKNEVNNDINEKIVEDKSNQFRQEEDKKAIVIDILACIFWGFLFFFLLLFLMSWVLKCVI